MMTYNDSSGGTATVSQIQVTEVQRTLRSSRNKGHDEHDASFEHDDEHHPEEEAALVMAEENMMDEDEEIVSYDESGKPVVDAEKLERRMMTVALMKSVVETSGKAATLGDSSSQSGENGKGNENNNSVGADDHPNHSYGLRRRSKHASGRDSPVDNHSSPRKRARATSAKAKAAVPACSAPKIPLPSPPALFNQPIPKPSVARVTEDDSSQSNTATVNHGSCPISDGLHSSQVPNPLMHATPPLGNPDVSRLQPLSPVTTNATLSTSLPPVPCPLPADVTKDEPQPDVAPSTGNASECATVMKRGRIFSIDIDPEGLEFPDMTIDVATQSVFVGNQPLPPIIGRVRAASLEAAQANLNVTFKQEEKELGSTEVSVVSNTGRDRAMSFEFFSFGINADEPLPPAPELSVSEVQPIFMMRPRGDSIIFDPDSFRDGGIHEEHALFKSRTTSLDLATDELSLMNTPGFVSAPTSIARDDNHPYSGIMASNPPQSTFSSLGNFLSLDGTARTTITTSPKQQQPDISIHTTFPMELLNKDGRIGIYLPEARKARIAKFHSKRKMRIWRKRIKYDCRKKLADSRPRIKGRFVKRSDMDE